VQAEELVHHFTVALSLLQHLDPPGVGARSLAECLRLQLGRTAPRASRRGIAPLRICAQPMELLARRDIRRLAQMCGDTEALVRQAIAFIGRLEPKPGRRFEDVERNIIVPDVLVVRTGRGAGAAISRPAQPRRDAPPARARHLRQRPARPTRREGHQALQQRLQEARWFIKNIQQRFDTILRVSNAIVERQKNFFVHGELAMRPLVLREIADELGLHESTISRVTTAKYMATPQGTFELKYFFGSGLGTETGGNASSTAVRALITPVCGGREHSQAAERQPDLRNAAGSRASSARAAPWPSTARRCASRPPTCAVHSDMAPTLPAARASLPPKGTFAPWGGPAALTFSGQLF
jgi:RNA polymerase sigma-54 factor